MPIRTTILYLNSKYHHETIKNSIFSEYLYIIASSKLDQNNQKELVRYSEIIQPKQMHKDTRTAEEMVNDVISKFQGGG